MWRGIKSSVMSSSTFVTANTNNNNNDPSASNRRDDNDDKKDGAAVVTDVPLLYSNVAAATDSSAHNEQEEQGLMVVPPGAEEDGEDDKKDVSSDNLSFDPQHLNLTDSLLETMQNFEDKNIVSTGNQQQHQQHQRFTILVDPHSGSSITSKEDDDENDEGVLVDEPLTMEEEAILAAIAAAPVQSKSNHRGETADVTTTHKMELLASPEAVPFYSAPHIKYQDVLGHSMGSTTSSKALVVASTQGAAANDGLAVTENVPAARGETIYSSRNARNDFADPMYPAWKACTLLTGLVGFTLFAFTGVPTEVVMPQSPAPPVVNHYQQEHDSQKLAAALELVMTHYGATISAASTNNPVPTTPQQAANRPSFATGATMSAASTNPVSTPSQASVNQPSFVTLMVEKVLNDADYGGNNITGDDDDDDFSVEYEELNVSSKSSVTWSLLVAMAYFLMYAIAALSIGVVYVKSTTDSAASGHNGALSVVKNEMMSSLSCFEGLIWFHQNFVASGKGRRGKSCGEASDIHAAYNKLTRAELLDILNCFGHYSSRNASKMALIFDLCNVYEQTLIHLTRPQIMELLQVKGYPVNRAMKKAELVSFALEVGF